MTPAFVRGRLGLRALVVAMLILAAAPAAALADNITVDDDRLDCPSAQFTSLTAAVAGAAQGDTIHICPGTYNVPGGAGAQGLRIDKNLKLIGAGASKVFIQPDLAAPSMAAVTPNPRDEVGNVVTIRRRTIELFNVELSGVTVRSYRPDGAGGEVGEGVEAGIAVVDTTNAKISNVRVTGLVPSTGPGTGPYATAPLSANGYGIIIANDQEATTDTVTVTNSLIEGYNVAGVLIDGHQFDGALAAPNGGTARGVLTGNKIVGGGAGAAIAQTGVLVDAGPCYRLTGNAITGNASAGSYGVLYKGAAVALHCAEWPSSATGNAIAGNDYGMFQGTTAGAQATTWASATGNWWGHAEGPTTSPLATFGDRVSGFVEYRPALTSAPAPLAVPPAVTDLPPTVVFDGLVDGEQVMVGDLVELDVVPEDDFGVKSVDYLIDGVPFANLTTPSSSGRSPYAMDWTPRDFDEHWWRAITAVVTDSAGQTTSVTARVLVGFPPPFDGPLPDADFGAASAGAEPAPSSAPSTTPTPGSTPAPPASTPVVEELPAPSLSVVSPKSGTPRLEVELDGPGTVTITLTAKVKVKGKVKTIVVGTATTTFADGGTKTVTVKMTDAGKALMAGTTGTVKVTSTTSVTSGGKTETTKQSLPMKGTKKAKKKG